LRINSESEEVRGNKPQEVKKKLWTFRQETRRRKRRRY
jgi:hypothetical protein